MVGLHENCDFKFEVRSGGLNQGAHQAILLLSLLSRTTGESKEKQTISWVELRTRRSLTNYCHRQTTLNLGSTNLIYCQLKIE